VPAWQRGGGAAGGYPMMMGGRGGFGRGGRGGRGGFHPGMMMPMGMGGMMMPMMMPGMMPGYVRARVSGFSNTLSLIFPVSFVIAFQFVSHDFFCYEVSIVPPLYSSLQCERVFVSTFWPCVFSAQLRHGRLRPDARARWTRRSWRSRRRRAPLPAGAAAVSSEQMRVEAERRPISFLLPSAVCLCSDALLFG
jgi:hypothetical protein